MYKRSAVAASRQHLMNAGRAKLPNGTRLGRYEILGLSGFGGMGDVYRATDTRLRRVVAVKVLPAEFAEDPDRLRRFDREARAAAALNHPHILATIDDVDEHERHSTSSRWSCSKAQTLREDDRPSSRSTWNGFCSSRSAIVDALDTAHRAGIVHRDITPANVLRDGPRRGQVSISDSQSADFNDARGNDSPVGDDSLRGVGDLAGSGVGTVAYMSPEQARGEVVDVRTDFFSSGWCCTRWPPVNCRSSE